MLLGRLLEHLGYETTVVMNVTDVNDKIYDAAKELGVPSAEHAAEMTRLYFEDTGLLGIGRPGLGAARDRDRCRRSSR